jgi:tetratricopeptide (TPR) repeat protein
VFASLQRFLSELSRRRVMRVVATYAIGTFGALQSADVIVSALGLPHGLMTGLVVLTFVGLPVAAVLAWVFDLTPEGVVRTAPLPAPGAAGSEIVGTQINPPAPARSSRLALVLGGAALMLGVAGASIWWKGRRLAPLANDLVAVLPFSVGGSEQYKYLREGLPELLSAGITGGGALRTVDERALNRAIKEAGQEPDDEAGRGLARRFGAGLYLVGSVLEVKDRLRLHVALYDANGGDRPIADANAEGEAATLFAMVDQILQKLRPGLLSSGRAAQSEPMVAMAQGATTSIVALKAFIEGEGALRDGNIRAALQALQRAVAEDENFAVAQYRLAVVASWSGEIPLGRAALYHALKNREKLPQRQRDLIEAFAAYWRGHAKEAEQRYRAILDKTPDDAESWYQLGEVLFHDGPFQGRPELEAKPFFQKAVQLEPNQRLYSIHLDELARLEHDRAGLTRLDDLQLKNDPNNLPTQWERAWASGDAAALAAVEEKLQAPDVIAQTLGLVINDSPNADGMQLAQKLVVRGLAKISATPDPALAKNQRVSLLMAESLFDNSMGKRTLADATLNEVLASTLSIAPTPALRALVPFYPHDKAEQSRALGILNGTSELPYGIHSPQEARRIRDYLGGKLSADLGDYATAEKAAQSLSTSNDADDSSFGADLGLAVRAHAAAAQGKDADALALLEQMSGGVPLAVIGTPYVMGEGDRWLRADLLAKQGRYAEALRWFDSVETNTIGSWHGPLNLRRAEMLDHLGKKKEAAEAYREFADLWRDADAPLKPLVENAQSRLGALMREQAP